MRRDSTADERFASCGVPPSSDWTGGERDRGRETDIRHKSLHQLRRAIFLYSFPSISLSLYL